MEYPPYLLDVLLFVFGACIGSFLNVVVLRLPGGAALSLLRPGSHCMGCLVPLKPMALIPIFSFACLGGRCGACRAKISARYPCVELAAAGFAVLAGRLFGVDWPLLYGLFFLYSLFVLAMIDQEHLILPDILVWPLLVTGLVVNYWGTFCDFTSATIGAAGGFGLLFVIRTGYQVLRKRDGLGQGDLKLLAAIGAWQGWQSLPFVLLIAASCATATALYLIRFRQHNRNAKLAFGPHLAVGALTFFVLSF